DLMLCTRAGHSFPLQKTDLTCPSMRWGPALASASGLHSLEKKVDHPSCRTLPFLAWSNVRHASECAEQIVWLDVVPKGACRNSTGNQRLDGNVEAVRSLAVKG